MKKQILQLAGLFVFLVTVFVSCGDPSSEGTCNDTKQPLITRGFSIAIEVMFADTIPWEGLATMEFEKTYCSGETSGHYSFTGFCDDDGYFYPGAVPTYDLANTYDVVSLTVLIVKDPAQGLQYHHEVTYKYWDVKPLLLGVDEIMVIYLPWASWEN